MKEGDKVICPKCGKKTELVTLTEEGCGYPLVTLCCLYWMTNPLKK